MLDGGRLTNGTYQNNYVRNLYLQAANLRPENGTFRFGLQHTMFIGAVEGALKTRWLGTTLAEESMLNSVDTAGVAFTGGLMNSMLKYGLMLGNGQENIMKTGNSDNRLQIDLMIAAN